MFKRYRTSALRLAAACLTAGLVGAFGLPAEAVEVVTKSGERLVGDRVYSTVTAVVLLQYADRMRIIPNAEVSTIDGVPLAQVVFASPAPASPAPQAQPSPTTSAEAAVTTGLYPLAPGTFRTYRLEQTRTTWHRTDRVMDRKATEQEEGLVKEVVVGVDPLGPVAMTETIIESAPGQPARESSIVHLIDQRTDGFYLLGQTIHEPALVPARQEGSVDVPPMLWPTSFSVGQTWTIGPFRHLGMYTAGRMQVFDQESVTVPAGTYPNAWRIQGFLHVFGGDQHLRAGRLVMEHGTLETTTWFVPGLGPVKEEAKFHAHQDFYPADARGPELPIVVEERSTRSLVEFQVGR